MEICCLERAEYSLQARDFTTFLRNSDFSDFSQLDVGPKDLSLKVSMNDSSRENFVFYYFMGWG